MTTPVTTLDPRYSHPRVVLTTGCNHWDRGLDVVVEGEARPETLGLAYAEM